MYNPYFLDNNFCNLSSVNVEPGLDSINPITSVFPPPLIVKSPLPKILLPLIVLILVPLTNGS